MITAFSCPAGAGGAASVGKFVHQIACQNGRAVKQGGLIEDDVRRAAAVNAAESQDSGLQGGVEAGDHGLQLGEHISRRDHRITDEVRSS